MGVSKRTTGVNLLNHIRQKNLLNNLQTTYVQRFDYNGDVLDSPYFRDKQAWIFTFSYDHQGNHYSYTHCGRSKRQALDLALEQAYEQLSTIIHHT